ncbi:hypothetical protein TB1_022134 [Malus domestica]
MVRGPVEDMKDGHHMLSGEGGTASSPRFKSKRRSEGPYIFKGVKERRGRTSQDSRSARREFLQAEIQIFSHLSHATSALDGILEIEEASLELEKASSEIGKASAFPDVSASITCRVSFVEIKSSLLKCRFQISNRHLLFQTCQCLRKRAISQHLVSIFRSGTNCLKPLLDCLPSLALEYSSSTSYASSSSTTFSWGTDKGSENDTSKHMETICQFILS